MRVITGDPEHTGYLAAAQALPQLQFEDFPLGLPDPAERVTHQCAQVRLGEPSGVARHDGRDNLTVAHANTVAAYVHIGTETDEMLHTPR